jgi:hypothetical protein
MTKKRMTSWAVVATAIAGALALSATTEAAGLLGQILTALEPALDTGSPF